MNNLILTTEQTLMIKEIFKNTKLCIEIDFEYFLTNEEIYSVECIERILDDNDCFNTEIIYYHNAIEFLRQNDSSLTESLNLADELGYSVSQINSELLASLLASQMIREEFSEYYSELENLIEQFMENIQEETE